MSMKIQDPNRCCLTLLAVKLTAIWWNLMLFSAPLLALSCLKWGRSQWAWQRLEPPPCSTADARTLCGLSWPCKRNSSNWRAIFLGHFFFCIFFGAFFFWVLAAGGSWWLWWLLVASVASMAPGSYDSSIIYRSIYQWSMFTGCMLCIRYTSIYLYLHLYLYLYLYLSNSIYTYLYLSMSIYVYIMFIL